jgi:hypothetical protein
MRRKLHGLTTPGIFRRFASTACDDHQSHPALSVLGAQLGRNCPRTDKHSRRHCRAGEEVKYIAPFFFGGDEGTGPCFLHNFGNLVKFCVLVEKKKSFCYY